MVVHALFAHTHTDDSRAELSGGLTVCGSAGGKSALWSGCVLSGFRGNGWVGWWGGADEFEKGVSEELSSLSRARACICFLSSRTWGGQCESDWPGVGVKLNKYLCWGSTRNRHFLHFTHWWGIRGNFIDRFFPVNATYELCCENRIEFYVFYVCVYGFVATKTGTGTQRNPPSYRDDLLVEKRPRWMVRGVFISSAALHAVCTWRASACESRCVQAFQC